MGALGYFVDADADYSGDDDAEQERSADDDQDDLQHGVAGGGRDVWIGGLGGMGAPALIVTPRVPEMQDEMVGIGHGTLLGTLLDGSGASNRAQEAAQFAGDRALSLLFAEGMRLLHGGDEVDRKAWRLIRLASAGDELHHEGIAGAKGDLCLRDGRGGAEVGHAPALGNGCDREDALHPGEGFADALTAAAAEGEVGELRAGGFGFGGEAVGIEAERIGEVLRGAAHDVLAEEDVGAGGDVVGAEVNFAGGHAAHGPGGWVEAHGFGEDLLGVAKAGVVGEGGEALLDSRCRARCRVRRGVWLRLRDSARGGTRSR